MEFDFTVDHDLRHGAGSLRRGDVHIGSAVATLTGTYAQHGESTILNANLSGHGMAIPELEALLPALNVELPQGSSLQGGTATVRLKKTVRTAIQTLVPSEASALPRGWKTRYQ